MNIADGRIVAPVDGGGDQGRQGHTLAEGDDQDGITCR